MEPVIKIIQTAQGDEVKWRDLGVQELRDYFSFGWTRLWWTAVRSFQTHLGFGGAFTESAAYVTANADEEARGKILKAYFNKNPDWHIIWGVPPLTDVTFRWNRIHMWKMETWHYKHLI